MQIIQPRLLGNSKVSLSQVKSQIDNLAEDPVMKLILRVGLIGLGLSLMLVAITWKWLPPEVPLVYSRPYGESQLISAWGLWLIPLAGLIIEMVAIRFSGEVVAEDKLLAQVVTGMASLVMVMALIGLIKVIWLVI